jgi:membrane protein implicated in regulation of membrane protease activity
MQFMFIPLELVILLVLWVALVKFSPIAAVVVLCVGIGWILNRIRDQFEEGPGLEAGAPSVTALPPELIGQVGICTSALRPVGDVQLGAKTYPARSELGYIKPNTDVQVSAFDGQTLIVSPVDPKA